MNLITQSEFDLIGHDVTISDSKNKEIIGINGKMSYGFKLASITASTFWAMIKNTQ